MANEMTWTPPALQFVQDYWVDACQRSVLCLDILRQRGNAYRERLDDAAPNVLSFGAELVRDGRTLPRPVNYVLVSIKPPEGVVTDPSKAPFIVVDPRAGHGPGIGGMKADSEIGEALAAGHPCYFVGFLPEPMPGQTIEDVCIAEATFVEDVIARHPHAEGKPTIIANCQAGWQIMMMAAMRPTLTGPIVLAGSPLSYWAGVRGKNPMRYAGGNLGGAWLTALAGDLGGGLFDGAHLVANFESLDLANTYWQKPYNVYSKADTEGERFLDFEEWWGTPVLLRAEEMQWIVDNLFVGDKLATGGVHTSDGVRVDLRNIRAPIVVLCSWGDNITPPQQALGWITDLYQDELEIAEGGQTIVYTLHQSIGHLGIFVSGKVAIKEHRKFVGCMDMIDLMPPGLYEAVITEVSPDEHNAELINGRYLLSLEKRTLDDIRALGANNDEDNRCFAAAARVSEINCGLYDAYVRPAVTAAVTPASAEKLRDLHPNRLRFSIFSDANPLMRSVEKLADDVRGDRRPVPADNPLLALERLNANWIRSCLDTVGAARDAWAETLFFNTYDSQFLQALTGVRAGGAERQAEKDLVREAILEKRRADLAARIEVGGTPEAVLRALIYVAQPEGGVDERAYAMLQELRAALPQGAAMSMTKLKQVLREQSLLMRLHEGDALAAVSKLLPPDAESRRAGRDALRAMIGVRGSLSDEGKRRLRRMEKIFEADPDEPVKLGAVYARRAQDDPRPRI
jgi:pimeloyl-ACP methyl ester carboxylesterase